MTEDVYKSYPSALDALAKRLKSRKFSPDEYYIVLTPDRYTQSVENALFAGGGALDCEVLTLSRLSRRLCPNDKILSREGGVMLTAQAIASVKDKLEYYGRAARFNDFAREVYETLMQISSSDADVAELYAKGATGGKLRDLALIKKEYDRLKSAYKDSPDRLVALINAIPHSELIGGAHIYAIGYANATRLNMRVFSALAAHARSFEFISVTGSTDRRRQMDVFCAPDKASQYKEIAALIRDYVYRGGRYGDVAIVCPSPRALSRILREYKIEFYADESVSLYDTPPLAALSYIYKLKSSSDAESVVGLCKNPFSGCDARDAEILQSYLTAHGITYGVFDKTITDEAAARAVSRAKYLTDIFCGSFADACEAVMDKGGFEDIRRELFDGETDTVGPVRALSELVRRVGIADFDIAAASFFSAARAVEVKSLPRRRDCVTVTMPQALRMTRCKLLIVTDFNEGVLPVATSDSGLISDNEFVGLGGKVEPTVREQNRRERAELFSVVRNAEKVVCAYTTAGGGRPSAFMSELADEAVEYDHSERCSVLMYSDDPEYIAKYACAEGAARELVSRSMTVHAPSVAAAVGKSDMHASEFTPRVACDVKPTVSVSELTHWFKCPYKRFLSDAVGLKERRTTAIGAPDFGIIVHDLMKRLLENEPYDCSRENIERILRSVLEEKQLFADDVAFARLVDDAGEYAAANINIIRAGEYSPELFEYPFGGTLYFGNAKTKFVGVIDRVDVCGDRARVVDYKTFNKRFDLKSCLDGSDMQLPLYAAAVEQTGKDVTGMFYLPFTPRYDGKVKPMSGYLVKDVDIAEEYDKGLAETGASEIISVSFRTDKSGQTEFSGRSGAALERDEFDGLIRKCVRIADVAADEIASGYIERAPSDGACDHCAYVGICGNNKIPRGDSPQKSAEEGGE